MQFLRGYSQCNIPIFYDFRRKRMIKKDVKPYYKTSKITGKTYDLFSIVRIINLQQVKAYITNGGEVLDVVVGENDDNKIMVVFYFDREKTKDLYDKWCKHELKW